MTHRGIEQHFLWLVRAMVIVAAAALAAGLFLQIATSSAAVALTLLHAGLIVLMATPVLRILIALAERLRRQDLQFIAITVVVLLELSLTMWLAMRNS